MNPFLTASHWQLFLLFCVLPYAIPFTLFELLINTETMESAFSPEVLTDFFIMIAVILLIFFGIYLGWFWSASIGLQKKLPQKLRMNSVLFKVAFFLPLIIIITTVYLIISLINNTLINQSDPSDEAVFYMISSLTLINMLVPLCAIYCYYFMAKTIKTAELSRIPKFEEYIGEIALIWFYPVGIWILQPRLNKLARPVLFRQKEAKP